MLSIPKPKSQLAPEVRRKIAHVKIFGIPCVIGFFALALASYPMGYLPPWVFMLGVCGEIFFGFYALLKIHSLRNSKRN
jgi:hypothetical protein